MLDATVNLTVKGHRIQDVPAYVDIQRVGPLHTSTTLILPALENLDHQQHQAVRELPTAAVEVLTVDGVLVATATGHITRLNPNGGQVRDVIIQVGNLSVSSDELRGRLTGLHE